MQDVRQSFVALADDCGVTGRIVLALAADSQGDPYIRVTAQACDSDGRPLPAVPGHSHRWPHPGYRTLTGMFLELLEQVYGSVSYMQLEEAPKAR